MKQVIKFLILLIVPLMIIFLIYIYDIKNSESKIDRFWSEIDSILGSKSGIENTQFSSIIKYEYFSNEYHKKISKEDYEKINTIEEAAELFNAIDINVNINSFNEYRYSDTDAFKTPIGNIYRVSEGKSIIIIYHVIVGIEGRNAVIKKINIEVNDLLGDISMHSGIHSLTNA